MINSIKDKIRNLFGDTRTEQEEYEKKLDALEQQLTNQASIKANAYKYNPFINNKGELVNSSLNYQSLLDNPNLSQKVKGYITQATGLTPTQKQSSLNTGGFLNSNPIIGLDSSFIGEYTGESIESGASGSQGTTEFNANLNKSSLASLDVATELPKLSENQIKAIISEHFSKSTVISPSDAKGIYNAQQQTGMSALAILGIGALESGYGTSNIAKKKNNIWGWGATNDNPAQNAKSFSQMSQGAMEFASAYMDKYYNKYGAKSISDAGTGNNPAGKGYAYYDSGGIDSSWATKTNNIMGKFYNTASNVR